MSKILSVNLDNFKDVVLADDKVILVDFFATWCGPCKMLSPILDDVAEELHENVTIAKIDIDESFELAKTYSVMSVPTMIIFKKGEEMERLVGLRNKANILDTLKKYVD